jgi:hypothetical protein
LVTPLVTSLYVYIHLFYPIFYFVFLNKVTPFPLSDPTFLVCPHNLELSIQ